jgi:fructose-1,6-bisphosphatase/inositol monophosphatase family enzyme
VTNVAELLAPLRQLHASLRDLLLAACEQYPSNELSEVVHNGAGDVTFMVDRISESALIDWFDREIAQREPIVLVGEGLPGGCITLPSKAKPENARWRIVVDPIDGTRGLMHQKRPGWILTGVAPNCGNTTSLADIVLAVQTEIPLLKQHLSDQLWAIHGQGAYGERLNRLSKESQPLMMRPSAARNLENGFATICRFFPGGRDILSALDDDLCARLVGPTKPDGALVSNDQYASTGGQLYGLAMGQDRFVADLRPLLEHTLHSRGQALGHCCHPYDLCTKLIVEEAGVLVTDECGDQVTSPLDTESNVSWIGYANHALRESIEPVLQDLLGTYSLVRDENDRGKTTDRIHSAALSIQK